MTYSISRVRSQDGSAFGWFDSKSHAIRIDSEMGMALLAGWRTNSQEDQEDLGVPPAGYLTAYGYWLPVEDAA